MRQQHVNEEVSADYKPKVNMKTSGDRINRKKRMVIPIRCAKCKQKNHFSKRCRERKAQQQKYLTEESESDILHII